jgi:hypothetical protein
LPPMGGTRSITLRCMYPFRSLARGRTLAIRPYSRPEKKSYRNVGVVPNIPLPSSSNNGRQPPHTARGEHPSARPRCSTAKINKIIDIEILFAIIKKKIIPRLSTEDDHFYIKWILNHVPCNHYRVHEQEFKKIYIYFTDLF